MPQEVFVGGRKEFFTTVSNDERKKNTKMHEANKKYSRCLCSNSLYFISPLANSLHTQHSQNDLNCLSKYFQYFAGFIRSKWR